MQNDSLWKVITSAYTPYPQLNQSIQVDLLIIGGGITGITTAYELIKQGKKIAIVEAWQIGHGTTGYSTGNLYVPVAPTYTKIKEQFNLEVVKKIISSRQKAIDYIEEVQRQNAINCDFARRPSYYFTNTSSEVSAFENEMNILKEAGIAIEYQDKLDIPVPFVKAAKIPNHAKFNPMQYVVSLAEKLAQQGCQIYENSPITSIVKERGSYKIITEKGSILAETLVIATHVPKGITLPQILSPAYRSYAIAARLKSAHYPNARFVNWDEPHYVISSHTSKQGGEIDCLAIAGSHHRVGQTESLDHIKKLENYLHEYFEVESIDYRWSSQHYQASDGLPYIGELKDNFYIGTGYYADGLVYGTVAGQLIADLINKKDNPYEQIYSPSRHKLLSSSCTMLKEGMNALGEYLKDFPENVQAHQFNEIKPNEGKTITVKGDKLAAYRDEAGKLHVLSAVCTHMKCIVNWNAMEKSWDCPCHGSRFTTNGKVIEGPAMLDLMPIKMETEK